MPRTSDMSSSAWTGLPGRSAPWLFTVRLFAEDGQSVVEQEIADDDGGYRLNPRRTTENGRPIPVAYAFFDGTVTLPGATPWVLTLEQYGLSLGDNTSDESIEVVAEPRPVATSCAPGPTPADAAALVQSLKSDPDLATTTPVAVSVGRAAGWAIDVVRAPGASTCDSLVLTTSDGGWRGRVPLERGSRLRLYLLDLPDWSTTPVMAIAIVAPEARFEGRDRGRDADHRVHRVPRAVTKTGPGGPWPTPRRSAA